jgi:hypothetical protein
MGDLDSAWTTIEEMVAIVRGRSSSDVLPDALLLSAFVGVHLGKADAVRNFVEALESLRQNPNKQLNADLLLVSHIFIGTAMIGDFGTLDSVLAKHGDWLIANCPALFFTQDDGRAIGRMAQAQGRAAGHAAMAGLLPRIANFMARLPSEKRDKIWLPDLISGFAETARDPGLLRDVAELLSETLAPQAARSGALLRDLANVDEARDAETVLARLDPDRVTLIRRLRGLPGSESKPSRKKRQAKK